MHTHLARLPLLAVTLLAVASCTGDTGGSDTGAGVSDDKGDGNGDGTHDTDSDTVPQVTGEGVVQSVAQGAITESQVTLTATLDGHADVAAACVSASDAEEIHLAEATGDASVALRFAGLLPDTDYECHVASTAPAGDEALVLTVHTALAPEYFPEADATFAPGRAMTGAYTIMNVRPECASADKLNRIVIVDPEGRSRWIHTLPGGMNIGIEAALDGYNRILWGGGNATNGPATVVDIFDGDQWQLTYPGSDAVTYHHDVKRIPDGRILSVEQTEDPGWEAFQLRLVDENGTTSWFYDVQADVADGWLVAGSPEVPDPHHLNWADVIDTPDGLVAYGSLCYAFETVAIDVATSKPLWKFGPGGDFTLKDPSGKVLSDDEFPQCQHGLNTDGTHLLVYDNGFNRGYTRAVEYTLDTKTWVATKDWEWGDEGFSEIYHGNVDWLTDDHQRVLVGEGNNDCGEVSTRHSQVVEIDRADDGEVHRLVLKDLGDWIYRAHRINGCDVFANARYCDTVASRVDELRPVLGL